LIFLLDTNSISELRKTRPHGALLRWYVSYPESVYALPAVALYEIQAGIEVTRRQDTAKALEIQSWIEDLERETTILPLDARAAREAARMMHGQSKVLIEDAMVAAIAKVNGLTIATRNTRDFERFGVSLVNPFTFAG
jgi:predicted nucleic acid-binding protein